MDETIVNPNSIPYILARLETKLDAALMNQKVHESADAERFAGLGRRITSLENARMWVYGVAAVLFGAITLFGDKVIAKVFF